MDSTSAAAAVEPGDDSTFVPGLVIKQEPAVQQSGGDSVSGTDNDGGRTIRKVTVLDPLKLKLLSRQNHNMLLSGLNAAKAKAKPPAPKPPPPSSPAALTVAETETHPKVTVPSRETEVSAASSQLPSVTITRSAPSTSKAGSGGGATLFRRQKAVPVAIARKLAQREKAKPQPKPVEESQPSVAEIPSEAVRSESAQPEPVACESVESAPLESERFIVTREG